MISSDLPLNYTHSCSLAFLLFVCVYGICVEYRPVMYSDDMSQSTCMYVIVSMFMP